MVANPESSLLSNIGGRVNLAVNMPNADNSSGLGLATGNIPNIGVGADNSSGLGLATGNIPNIGAGVSDDNFFHLTCHIDPNLIHKIEKGEFIELEKLLPKDKLGRNGDDNRLEWVH